MVYGSESSITFVHDIYKTLAITAMQTNIDMAEATGSFPGRDTRGSIEASQFIRTVTKELSSEYLERYIKYGRRNFAFLTTPPAGTKSIEAGCSSGIEPNPFLEYTRKRKINANEASQYDQVVVDSANDTFAKYTYTHPSFVQWKRLNIDKPDNHWHESLAHKIEPMNKIRIIAAAQKWVDHAISNTTNLPSDTTLETVQEIYYLAWRLGCKGVTIYREGSRDAIIEQEKASYIVPAKRPERLQARLTTSGNKIVIIGTYKNMPFEVFGGQDSDLVSFVKDRTSDAKWFIDRKACDEGHEYVLSCEYEDAQEGTVSSSFDGNLSKIFKQNESGITRLISMPIRAGLKPNIIIGQLSKFNDDRTNNNQLVSLIIRGLKEFVQDGDEVRTGKAYRDLNCQTPKDCKLVYKENCVTCLTCGMSKC
jgi:ribonucleoside-diphosphate reductase alpha chain